MKLNGFFHKGDEEEATRARGPVDRVDPISEGVAAAQDAEAVVPSWPARRMWASAGDQSVPWSFVAWKSGVVELVACR